VTGAAGFAGSHLVDLLAPGGDVVAWHRPGGAPPRRVDGVTWQAVEMLDRASVWAAIEAIRPARVYHCAGAAHVGQAWNAAAQTLAVNVRGTHYLIEAVRRFAPDARVLVPSSGLVYAPSDHPLNEEHALAPNSPYGLSKLAQELLGHDGGPPDVCIARPFNHFGPRQDPGFVASGFARRIAEIERGGAAPELQVGNLEPRRDLTDVRDTVKAYRMILEKAPPARPFNVCTGRAIGVRDLLDLLLARARVQILVVQDPDRFRPNDLPLLQGDPTRIRSELGWTPGISIERTIDDLLDYWRDRLRAA
jgi:GDP-4-dehydro-6-deoxy-D-mannose reductase